MSSALAIIVFLGEGKSEQSLISWPTVIGAVVGGTISLLGTVLVERQRGRAADRSEARRRLREGRQAARLIVAELEDTRSVLRVALGGDVYRWPSSVFELRTAAWDAHGAALADTVSDPTWELVAAPYGSFRYVNLLGNPAEETARTLLDAAVAAIEALQAWAAEIEVP